MSWSSRRRSVYLLVFLIALVVLVGVPGFFLFYDEPTCTDGKRNGDEEGVDCGGNCPIVCSFRAAEPIVHWERFFEVIPGVYAVLALVENPNSSVQAFDVPYTFKLRANDNVLVYEEKGRMYVPPKSTVPVFVTGLRTGERLPTRAEFTLGEPTWVYGELREPDLDIREQNIEREDSQPTVTAIIRNNEDVPITREFSAVAVLYDQEGNAINASRTIIDGMEPLSQQSLIFTWPQPLDASVARIDIIPVFAPR